jgi:CRISPR-associated protein Csm3
MLFPSKLRIKEANRMKLKDYARVTATLRLKSGLHIGTGEKVERGEALPVMESPRNGMPYIPGSSLKGKMRHLLELSYGRQATDPKDSGSHCWCGKCQICQLFGSGSSGSTYEPTRLIFRDCFLTKASEELLEKINLEEKPGVRIDRITGKAARGALFPIKRIPDASEFGFEISARVFEEDNIDALIQWLRAGLYLLEQDALGGGGTRGSGHIEFLNIKFDGKDVPPDWREQHRKVKDSLAGAKIKKSS